MFLEFLGVPFLLEFLLVLAGLLLLYGFLCVCDRLLPPALKGLNTELVLVVGGGLLLWVLVHVIAS